MGPFFIHLSTSGWFGTGPIHIDRNECDHQNNGEQFDVSHPKKRSVECSIDCKIYGEHISIKCDCRVKEIFTTNWVDTYFFSWRCRLCLRCRSWLVEVPKCTVGRLELYYCISVTAVSPKIMWHSQYFIIFFTASVKSMVKVPPRIWHLVLYPSYLTWETNCPSPLSMLALLHNLHKRKSTTLHCQVGILQLTCILDSVRWTLYLSEIIYGKMVHNKDRIIVWYSQVFSLTPECVTPTNYHKLMSSLVQWNVM